MSGVLIRIYVSESHRYKGRSKAEAIVEALAAAGIAGATAFKGIAGFGRHRTLSSAEAVDAWVDLPILIEAVDQEAKVEACLPALERLLDDGLVTIERVQTVLNRSAHGIAS
jgi:PII-like signaling protein